MCTNLPLHIKEYFDFASNMMQQDNQALFGYSMECGWGSDLVAEAGYGWSIQFNSIKKKKKATLPFM
jgi:hypothetical protein